MSSFQIKEGVKLPPILKLFVVFCDVCAVSGVPARVTSGTDGKHMVGSKHYEGLALDFGSRNMSPTIQQSIAKQVRERLGPDYDFIVEGDHFHGEYDPKGRL